MHIYVSIVLYAYQPNPLRYSQRINPMGVYWTPWIWGFQDCGGGFISLPLVFLSSHQEMSFSNTFSKVINSSLLSSDKAKSKRD